METNRMMSPGRQAACGSCAGRAALSLAVLAQGRLADSRAVRRSIGLRKRRPAAQVMAVQAEQ